MSANQTIPVVDLKDYLSDSSARRQEFVTTLGSALEDIGFFAIENHGVDQSVIDKAYSVAQKFFDLPEDTKKRYEVAGIHGQRGFTSFGKEHAKGNDAPDLKEFWHVGRDLPAGHALTAIYPANVWPEEVREFRQVFSQLYNQLEICADKLLEACALYLGEAKNTFSGAARDGNTILRVIHYPEIAADKNPNSVRSAAHEDINLITLLCEATAPGLELLQRDGVWRPIHALKGQIIADAGDMLQNITNGVLKSTTHRVTNPDNNREKRFSMPYFVHPRSEVDLSPLAGCVAKCNGEKRYPNITAGDYLQQRLREIGLAY